MNAIHTLRQFISNTGAVALSISLLAFTACKVGPNYHAPIAKVPAAWGESQNAAQPVEQKDATIAEWWTTFQDPTLNSLIERAVKTNPDLRLAQARVREARAQRGVVNADLYPTVNVNGSYQRSRFSENSTGGQTGTGTGTGTSTGTTGVSGNLYQVGFDASWELDVFGGVRRNIEAADADIAAAIEDRRDVMVTLLSEVARNYIELRSDQRQEEIARENQKSQQDTLELTKVRFDAGLVSDLDVARAEAQVRTTASQIPAFESQIRQSIHALSVLLGQEPNALAAELSPSAMIPQAPSEVPANLPSEMLRRRPDVRRAERELAGATARIGVATSDLFPKFSLTAALGLAAGKVNNLTDSGSKFWTILPGVTWPIFDFGRIRKNIAVQNAREEQAAVIYEQTVLTSLREVEDALVSYSKEQERRTELSGAVDSNRRAVDLANQLYQNGLADFLSVLQSQRDLYLTENALIQSNRDVSSNLVALYKALGGGWEIESKGDPGLPDGKAGDRTLDLTPAKVESQK